MIQIEGTNGYFCPMANRLSRLQGHTFELIHKTAYLRPLPQRQAEADSLEGNGLIARHVYKPSLPNE